MKYSAAILISRPHVAAFNRFLKEKKNNGLSENEINGLRNQILAPKPERKASKITSPEQPTLTDSQKIAAEMISDAPKAEREDLNGDLDINNTEAQEEAVEALIVSEVKKNIFKKSAEAAREKGSIRREAVGKKISEAFRFARNTVDSLLGLPEGITYFAKEVNEARKNFQNRVAESGRRFESRCLETGKKAKEKIIETSKKAAAFGLHISAEPVERAIEAFFKIPARLLERTSEKTKQKEQRLQDKINLANAISKTEIDGLRDQIKELRNLIKENQDKTKELIGGYRDEKDLLKAYRNELILEADKVIKKAKSKRKIRDLIAKYNPKS